jgi:hypothetical protein
MKSKLIQDGQEKTFALVFDAGEEVVAGLLQFAKATSWQAPISPPSAPSSALHWDSST